MTLKSFTENMAGHFDNEGDIIFDILLESSSSSVGNYDADDERAPLADAPILRSTSTWWSYWPEVGRCRIASSCAGYADARESAVGLDDC